MNSYAIISTTEAARLIKRLCAHWGHAFTVEAKPNLGRINFGDSQCQLTGDDVSIRIDLNCPDETTANRMQNVVFDHLQRMGKTELPAPVWNNPHPDGAAGSNPFAFVKCKTTSAVENR